jgi:YVTN family beta-propeller protein
MSPLLSGAAPLATTNDTARRRTTLWLVAAAALAVCAAAAGAVALLSGSSRPDAIAHRRKRTGAAKAARRPVRRIVLVEHRTGALDAPVQDEAAASLGRGRAMLLGGLTAADTSRADVRVVGPARDHAASVALSTAVHDTAAVRIGDAVYVFGGGTNAGTQSDEIVRVPLRGGAAAIVGRMPAPSSDQAAAAIGGTAYVVGGYTGTRWLDTIVAWRPGSSARVVARLPYPVRYAAVASAGGKLVIAGGSLENGSASKAVLAYTPATGRVVRIARLPAATTHAAAAPIGRTVYVIGGRGAILGSATNRVVAIQVPTGNVREAGRLAAARSDLAAVSLGSRILLAGGRSPQGTLTDLSELVPVAARRRVAAGPSGVRRPEHAASAKATTSVYAYDGAGMIQGAARLARPLVYVPNSQSASVDVIDPNTFKVIDSFPVGLLPQHVVPSYDLGTLYVTNDLGNSLTAIDPRTGKPVRTIPVEDPYNMYFTPGGRYAIVVAERLGRLDFRDAHSFALHRSLAVPCRGVDHMDFSADGSYLLASCEFSGQLVKVDVRRERVVGTLDLPDGRRGMPQDVRLSPDGRTFYVADLIAGGVWKIDGDRLKVDGFVRTGAGTHGLYPSRDGKDLYVANRSAGTVSVLSFATQRVVDTWRVPGGSPDMGGVSADGNVLWLSGRYDSEVYAISTRTGQLLARIPVGAGPHGLCVWPQPGRYSLGHTDNMR